MNPICKYCYWKTTNNIFKVTDFNAFLKEYETDPNILNSRDHNGFTFIQNLLWNFSRERFKHSNKLLGSESIKAFYYLLQSLPHDRMRFLLETESLDEENFRVLHDYAKNLFYVNEQDGILLRKLEESGFKNLLELPDNSGLTVYDYIELNRTNRLNTVKSKQKKMKQLEESVIKIINSKLNKCNKCNRYLDLFGGIKSINFADYRGVIDPGIIRKIILLRKDIVSIFYNGIEKENDGHVYCIKAWESKLNELK